MTTRNDDAFVADAEFFCETLENCCSGFEIARLEEREVWRTEKHYFDWYERESRDGWSSRPRNLRRDEVLNLGNLLNDLDAVPCWVMFAAVLNSIKPRNKAARDNYVYQATDNYVGRGDVHNGPFSTRNFVDWLADNNLAEVAQVRTRRLVAYSFSFKGKAKQINAMLSRAKTEALRLNKKRREVWDNAVHNAA